MSYNDGSTTHESMVQTMKRVIASRAIRDGHVRYKHYKGVMQDAIRSHASRFRPTLLNDVLDDCTPMTPSHAADLVRIIHADVQENPTTSAWAPFWSAYITSHGGQLPPSVDYVALDARARADAERRHFARFPAVTDPYTLPQC